MASRQLVVVKRNDFDPLARHVGCHWQKLYAADIGVLLVINAWDYHFGSRCTNARPDGPYVLTTIGREVMFQHLEYCPLRLKRENRTRLPDALGESDCMKPDIGTHIDNDAA
jgi:hypothetical protein